MGIPVILDDGTEETWLPDGRVWIRCWNCGGDIYVDHDCGEDCCACAWPEDNVECDICDGKGGWYKTGYGSV